VSKRLDFDEIEGKTITKVFCDFEQDMLIVFSDGTFCCLYAYSDDGEAFIENRHFNFNTWGEHADELLALGVVTQEQYDKYKLEKEHYSRQAVEARRAEYEKLKAEFADVEKCPECGQELAFEETGRNYPCERCGVLWARLLKPFNIK
jgi:predicted RNA-binding Zn-ribbon protein involved in translation (DUF1610 family)